MLRAPSGAESPALRRHQSHIDSERKSHPGPTQVTRSTKQDNAHSESKKSISTNEDNDNDKQENMENFANDAKMEMAEAEEEVINKAEEAILSAVKDTEINLEKALEYFLRKKMHLSANKIKDVELEVEERLVDTVREQLREDTKDVTEFAEEDLDSVIKGELAAKVKNEDIMRDVDSMQRYIIDETKKVVDSIKKSIETDIRSITEKIEHDVIKEKLGVDVDEKTLEISELEERIDKVSKDFDNTEDKAFSTLERGVAASMKDIEKALKEALENYLQNDKGLSKSEVEDVENEVINRLKDEVGSEVLEGEMTLDDQITSAHKELEQVIEEDIKVIERAKEMGMVSDVVKDVELIEKDIEDVNRNFDKYIEDATEAIGKNIQDSIQEKIESIEREVLKKKKIDVSDGDLSKITKNAKSSLISES